MATGKRDPASEDVNFKDFVGENAPTPYQGTTEGSLYPGVHHPLYLNAPSLKSCVHPRMVCHNPGQKFSDNSLFSCFFSWQLLVINNLHACNYPTHPWTPLKFQNCRGFMTAEIQFPAWCPTPPQIQHGDQPRLRTEPRLPKTSQKQVQHFLYERLLTGWSL